MWALFFCASLWGCIRPFPDFEAIEDIDGDGFTPAQGDCDESDALTNPDAYECDIRGYAPADNDCDGAPDGPALPWEDGFDDGFLASHWVQAYPGFVLHEHAGEGYNTGGDDTGSERQVIDGVVEQVADSNFSLYLAPGAECWSDIELEARFIPGPQVQEFQCHLLLRASSLLDGGDSAAFAYKLQLEKHSDEVDGNYPGSDYDGGWYSHLERIWNGEDHCLSGNSCEPNHAEDGTGDLMDLATSYTVRASAVETEAGTVISCTHWTEGRSAEPCFDAEKFEDADAERPLTGGIGIVCSSYNYNWWETEPPEGVAIDYVLVREAE